MLRKTGRLCVPYVLRENSEGLLRKQGSVLKQFDRIWVRSYDGIGFAREELYLPAEKLALDAGLYVSSNEAAVDLWQMDSLVILHPWS